jgi:hypothetical protein
MGVYDPNIALLIVLVADVLLIRPARLGGLLSRPSGCARPRYKWAHDVWRLPTPLATMLLCVMLFFLFLALMLALLSNLHRLLILEATDRCGATVLLDGSGNVGLSDVMIAIFRGEIKVLFYQGVDANTSIRCQEYESSNKPHPPDPLSQDWEEVTHAALSSTREVIQHLKRGHDSDEDTCLYTFIQSVTLSTLLHLFFRLPITPTNVEEAVWIVSNAWQTEDCWQGPIGNLPELSRMVKPSPNPSGVFALLLATQRIILAAICSVEGRGEGIHFLRRAGTLLCHPTSPEPDTTRLVERIKQSYPPFQSVHGRLPLRCPPLRCMNFLIPTDSIPPSPCILGLDGTCLSWLHKADLPGQPACGGEKWLIRATTIILSAVEVELRKAHLTVDRGKHDPEAWEDWVLRRLRVG